MAKKKKSRKQQKLQNALVIGLAAAIAAAGGGAWIYTQTRGGSGGSLTGASGSQEDVITYGSHTYRYNDHLSNYLFLGVDSDDTVENLDTPMDVGQADAIYLAVYDRAEETLEVLAIPRDTMTTITTYNLSGEELGTSTDHLNLQYAYGDGGTKSCELMAEAVSNLLYQVPIQGYCSLSLDGIPLLTDVLGGVEVVVPDDSLEETYPEFTEGSTVLLTKENTEAFVRYRDITESQSALVRQNRQQVFLEAYLKKAQETFAEDPSIISEIYDGVSDYLVTNMSNDLFADLLEASENGGTNLSTVPGEGVEGAYYDEYHVDQDALYEMILDLFYEEAD